MPAVCFQTTMVSAWGLSEAKGLPGATDLKKEAGSPQSSVKVFPRCRWPRMQKVVCSWTNRCRVWAICQGHETWNLTPLGNWERWICLPIQETEVHSLGRVDPLEKGMATDSRVLASESHGQRSPVGYRPRGSQRVRHDWLNTHTHG